jgi:hypothetical protein
LIPPLRQDERIQLTQRAFNLLDAWEVPRKLQPELLGLGRLPRARSVQRYRLGTPLPETGDSYGRVALLLKIDLTLRKLFPHSELSANLWVTTLNPSFSNRPPLDTMLQGGLAGIRQVERYLNAPNGWNF